VLPRAFAEAAGDMRGDHATRDERALAITQSAMADAIGELYAARYFPPAQKARCAPSSPTSRRVPRARGAAAWLSPASRQIALAKLDRCTSASATRRRGRTGAICASTPTTRSATRSASRARVSHALARLAQPYDPHEWVLTPQTAGAVLNFQQNAYMFAAALLQPPKYDAAASTPRPTAPSARSSATT
jgi:putative endopeptidase